MHARDLSLLERPEVERDIRYSAVRYARFGSFATGSSQVVNVRYAADCVAKLLAALRTRNYQIQMNGVFKSTLRACARP